LDADGLSATRPVSPARRKGWRARSPREPHRFADYTFACAMTAEERVARRFGATRLVGLGVSNGVPDGRLVSFGVAGSLRDDLPVGTVIDATRVVDESGAVLWEGEPLGAERARHGTILGASRIVDDPAERARLHEATGADAVDMESATLARSGRLAGCIRSISDTPTSRLAGLAHAVTPGGRTNYAGLVRGFAREPRETLHAIRNSLTALRALEAIG
jgi:adenosylhomocysteine nucleosidase